MVGDRRIAVPDMMLWLTVLGSVLVAVALCWVIVATIRQLFLQRPPQTPPTIRKSG
jgi:hypothetical protein